MNEPKPRRRRSRRVTKPRLYTRDRSPFYWLYYWCHGVPVRVSTGVRHFLNEPNASDNKRKAARRKADSFLKEKTDDVIKKGKQHVTEIYLVNDLYEPMIRKLRQKAAKDVEHVVRRWKLHLKPFFGTLETEQVTSDCLDKYVDERTNEGAGPATVNRETAILRRMLRLAYTSTPQKITFLPAFPHLSEPPARTGFLAPASSVKIREAGDATGELWLRTLAELYHKLGWRKTEGLKLTVRQFDRNAGVLHLRDSKNGNGREVPLTATLRSLLTQCALDKEQDDFLITRDDGEPIKDFRKTWRNLCIVAGVGRMVCRACDREVSGKKCECGSGRLRYHGLTVHDMRRTAARNLRRAGVSEGVIMKIGGWKTRSIFDRYNIISTEDMREGLAELEKREEEAAGRAAEAAAQGDAQEAAPSARPN
jgi:site-specific recombinase XerD